MALYGRRFLNLPLVLLAAWMALVALPASSRASDPVREEIAKVGQKILKLLEEQNQTAIAIGTFVGPAQLETNAGPGFQEILCEELERLKKGTVQKTADLSVRGRYARIDDAKNPGLIAVKLTAEVFDRKDESILKLALEFTDTKDIARILGLTVSLPREGTKEERHKEIDKRLKNPDVFIHGDKKTLISSSEDSPYAVELLAKPLAAPKEQAAVARPAQKVEGLAFVDVKIGELYEVRVYNNSKQEVAVSLAIDGLDQFTFSEDRNDKGEPRFTHFILGKGETATLVGWHRTVDPKRKDNFLSFLVTEYGQGAASKLPAKSQGKVGTLTVSFANSFPASRAGGETGFGPPREVKQEVVKRSIDPPHDFVTARYNR